MRIFPSVAVALLLPLITDVQAQGLACGGTQKQQQVAELMFGRKIVDRIAVTEDEWAEFVDQEITPRFPDGLTVFSAAGQWRDNVTNKIVREPSKIVLIVRARPRISRESTRSPKPTRPVSSSRPSA
jgi:hypothetical protein